jgi:glycerophosphoryl diester phosphodiesterase
MSTTAPDGEFGAILPRVSRIGHRGAAGHAPENTLAAIETGVTLGADFVEIDVRRTADGVLVALHDASVKRTTDGRGRVDALSLRQVRAFKAGNGERIPTVEEVLKSVAAGPAGLMLELKVAGAADLTVETVRAAEFKNPVVYASFLHHELARIRVVEPEAALMMLFDRLPRAPVAYAAQYQPAYVGLRHDRANRPLVEAFHGANMLVWVYTANRPEDIRRVLALGVDGVISDYPERIAGQ